MTHSKVLTYFLWSKTLRINAFALAIQGLFIFWILVVYQIEVLEK